MPDKEITSRIQAVPKLLNQTLLLCFVEIDHHVAAKDDVVATRKEFRFQVVEVELYELFQLRLDGVLGTRLFEVAQPAGIVHGFHLLVGVDSFLADAQTGIADVGSDDLHFPRRRDEWLRRRHLERERVPQVIVSKRIADQDRDGIGLLTGRAPGAPDAKSEVAALLFAAEDFFENRLLEEIELRTVAKEACLVYRQILEKQSQLRASLSAGEQPVVGVERIELANLKATLQAVFEEMRAAFIEKHAAFLINESLQEL